MRSTGTTGETDSSNCRSRGSGSSSNTQRLWQQHCEWQCSSCLDYELPDVTGQAGEAGAAGAFMERIGKFAHEHGIIKPAEFYANDRDHWGD
uniref:Uncharacterized protein n=1 Tax=Tetradesmus obliquus TaxID=3088 RepID=A0A383VFT0_TETOB